MMGMAVGIILLNGLFLSCFMALLEEPSWPSQALDASQLVLASRPGSAGFWETHHQEIWGGINFLDIYQFLPSVILQCVIKNNMDIPFFSFLKLECNDIRPPLLFQAQFPPAIFTSSSRNTWVLAGSALERLFSAASLELRASDCCRTHFHLQDFVL